MTPPAKESTTAAYGSTLNVSTDVMVATVIFFFIIVLFFAILFLYCKHVWAPDLSLRRRRSRLIFAAEAVPVARHGLDSAILHALPITTFSCVGLEEELECAVCLCALTDGEEVCMLPKCNHGFHLDCIDMWFHSHSTCPLCRSPVVLPPPDSGAEGISAPEAESAVEIGIPSSSVLIGKPDGMLVIDIPERVMQGFSSSPNTPLPTSDDYENQMMMTTKTTTPTSARLRSLTRLLSRGKRAMVGPSAGSPREIEDIEQGQGLLPPRATPRIPKNS